MIVWPTSPNQSLQIGHFLEGVEEGDALVLDLGREGQELLKGDGAERAEHEQRAVGEVDDAERPEDQRQAERDQGVGAALVEAVQQLKNDRVQHEHPHLTALPQRTIARRADGGMPDDRGRPLTDERPAVKQPARLRRHVRAEIGLAVRVDRRDRSGRTRPRRAARS